MCCTVRGDLIRIVNKLLKRRATLDAIIIETTGLANPGAFQRGGWIHKYDMLVTGELYAVLRTQGFIVSSLLPPFLQAPSSSPSW